MRGIVVGKIREIGGRQRGQRGRDGRKTKGMGGASKKNWLSITGESVRRIVVGEVRDNWGRPEG